MALRIPARLRVRMVAGDAIRDATPMEAARAVILSPCKRARAGVANLLPIRHLRARARMGTERGNRLLVILQVLVKTAAEANLLPQIPRAPVHLRVGAEDVIRDAARIVRPWLSRRAAVAERAVQILM